MKIIKDFIEFRRLKSIYEEIELNDRDKRMLSALHENKELLEKLFQKTKNHLSNKTLSDDLEKEFVRGSMYTLNYIRGIIK